MRKGDFSEKLALLRPLAVLERHPVLSCAVLAAAVAGSLLLLFWFVAFSGLGATADFVYARF